MPLLVLGYIGRFLSSAGTATPAGFVLARAFTGHTIGNFVLGAIATAARDFQSALSHFSAVVAFLIGVFFGAWTMRPLKSSRLPTVMTLKLILILVSPLLLFAHLAGTESFAGFRASEGRISASREHKCSHDLPDRHEITSLISSEAEKYLAKPFPPAASAYNPKVALTVERFGQHLSSAP